MRFGTVLFDFDGTVVDGLVNLAGAIGRFLGRIDAAIDKYLVDGAVNALAAACIAALVYFAAFTQTEPLIATIEGSGQRHFVATIDVQRGTVAVVPAAFSADATRVPELWLIPPDGKPRPVGLLRADAPVTLTLSGDLAGLVKNNAVLAVSLEPPGGSTTGLPTGPVIGTGKLTNL